MYLPGPMLQAQGSPHGLNHKPTPGVTPPPSATLFEGSFYDFTGGVDNKVNDTVSWETVTKRGGKTRPGLPVVVDFPPEYDQADNEQDFAQDLVQEYVTRRNSYFGIPQSPPLKNFAFYD